MTRPKLILLTLLTLAATQAAAQPTTQPEEKNRPNILMIIIDDVAPNLHSVNNQPSPVPTPNIQRLASRGTWFQHAYADAPSCCPSRTALLTGIHSARSGVYYNTQSYKRDGPQWLKDAETLPALLLRNGYLTANFGKLYHTRDQSDHQNEFTPGYFKPHNQKPAITHTDATLLKQILPNTLSEIPGTTSKNWSWGILPDTFDPPDLNADPTLLQQDTEQANNTINLISQKHEKPFFAACGFWRPHVQWTVPKRYYDQFPLDQIQLPKGYKENDLQDLPKPAQWLATHRGEHNEIVAGNMWKKSLQGYYASLSYIDEQIGRVLTALENSPNANNTIIVFLSDNGMHLGEKDHWLKYTLWEQSCGVFLSISAPNLPTHQTLTSPVSLIDLYPTLLSLTGLEAPTTHTLDGINLHPLLTGTTTERGKPVLQTYGRSNHALRDNRYRYIRYRNHTEELYDHDSDPHEWTNLANDPKYTEVKTRLAQHLPKQDADDIPQINNGKGDGSPWQDEAFN